jgi:hypothetical protein
MAVTVGRSAEKAVKAAVYLTLNVAALTTTLGASATPKYAVTVHGKVPQTLTYPHVRIDAAGELANSTFGINGKDCRSYVQIFAQSEEQALEIQSQVIALMNPVNNYHTLSVSGYTTIHVNYDGTQVRDPGDEGNAVGVYQRTVMFTVTVEES